MLLSSSSNSRSQRSLGRFYHRKDEMEKAIFYFQRALKINSLFPEIWFAAGACAMKLEMVIFFVCFFLGGFFFYRFSLFRFSAFLILVDSNSFLPFIHSFLFSLLLTYSPSFPLPPVSFSLSFLSFSSLVEQKPLFLQQSNSTRPRRRTCLGQHCQCLHACKKTR